MQSFTLLVRAILAALIATPLVAQAKTPGPLTPPSPAGSATVADVLSWRTEPALQHSRSAHALAATDSALFVVGGTGAIETPNEGAGSAEPILEIERFDGAKWSVETTLPGEGLNAPAAVIFEHRLWVIGGFGTTSNVPVATVQVYDFESRTWSEAPPLPAPRGGHAAIVFGDRIHVLGGGNSVSTLADHCAFDPATRSWQKRAPLSRSKGSPAVVVFEGQLWAIGGRSGGDDFGDVECFDEATNHWTAGPAIEPRGTEGAVVYHGSIWVVGGESQARGRCLSSVLRFDPMRRVWDESTPLPTARNYARTAILGDALFVVGGSPTPGFSHASRGSNLVESARLSSPPPPVGK